MLIRAATFLATALAIVGCTQSDVNQAPAQRRVVVLGFDGLDPNLTERWMEEGLLPEFSRLRQEGHYQRLATTNPPQSPVAWSSFATGKGAGEHGIFDFLRRDPATYRPDFSIAKFIPPSEFKLFGWHLPLGEGTLANRRRGEPFWSTAEQRGDRATVLRVPVTYPPEPVHRMLSGMGVPDLLGSQGTYTYYTTSRREQAESGGRVVQIRLKTDGTVETELEGPTDPLKPEVGSLKTPLAMRFTKDQVTIDLAGDSRTLALNAWSAWWPVQFEYGLGSVQGMVRLRLLAGLPRPLLYVSPIQADPLEPALPLTSPPEYAPELAERIGRYHTLGMPEETWSLNQGHLDEQGFLDMVKTTFDEGEAMLHDTLSAQDSELVIKVFVQTDRVSHMFWRGLDPLHPQYAESSELARGAIRWVYQQADRVLGDVRRQLRSGDQLVVLSDHGFSSFRRAAHLNRWLVQNGWLVLKDGESESAPLFAQVDWSRSRAYAMGLNGLYLNERGREAQGIVEPSDRPALLKELMTQLAGWQDTDGSPIVSRTFLRDEIYPGTMKFDAPDLVVGYAAGYRASWQTSLGGVPEFPVEDNHQAWSGDHCVDPDLVPGVLFLSFKPDGDISGITSMAEMLLQRAAPRGTEH